MVLWALGLGSLEGRASAGSASSAPPGTRGLEVTPGAAEGQPLADVWMELRGASGEPAGDEVARRQVEEAFGLSAGQLFRPLLAETGLSQVLALPFVSEARFRLFESQTIGAIVAALYVTVQPEGVEPDEVLTGMFHSGDLRDLPELHKSDRALLKLILNGGVGGYATVNPFFGRGEVFLAGSPIAKDPPEDAAAWMEWYVEPGVGGITRIGSLPLYTYGAVTYVVAQTLGQDLYNSYSRQRGTLEKAYAGFLYDLPGQGNVMDVSAGRQIYQLREGFLISKVPGSTNIGRLGGVFLGPRSAFEKTAVARAKWGRFRAEGIFLEPSEYDEIPNADTQVAGGTVTYAFPWNVELGFTYLQIVNSDNTYPMPDGRRLSPEGVHTYSGSLRAKALGGLDGLWFKGEYAYQGHEDYPMAAQAGYGWLGYDAQAWPWRPGLSYRYSIFTGDDPDTSKLERFDPLFSGGQQNFVPGMVMNAVTKNANLITHRVRGSLKPTESLEIVLDYFRFRAHELNNFGAISPSLSRLSSKRLADEFDLSAFLFLSKNLYFQALAAVAIPDQGIEDALGGDVENWYNLQAALYLFF